MALNAEVLKQSLFEAMSPQDLSSLSNEQLESLKTYAGRIAQAIVGHFQAFADVSFEPGSIQGGCPSGGGPLVGGNGTFGKIS